jgi:hypothetical protein
MTGTKRIRAAAQHVAADVQLLNALDDAGALGAYRHDLDASRRRLALQAGVRPWRRARRLTCPATVTPPRRRAVAAGGEGPCR